MESTLEKVEGLEKCCDCEEPPQEGSARKGGVGKPLAWGPWGVWEELGQAGQRQCGDEQPPEAAAGLQGGWIEKEWGVESEVEVEVAMGMAKEEKKRKKSLMGWSHEGEWSWKGPWKEAGSACRNGWREKESAWRRASPRACAERRACGRTRATSGRRRG